MRTSIFALAAAFSVSMLAACAADTSISEDGVDEEITGETEDALSVNGNYGFYVVTRRDFRKCVSPLCGGVFVKRANRPLTTCADGTRQPECYVGSYDFAATGLDSDEQADFRGVFEASHAVVRATMVSTRFNGQRVGKLRVAEAWKGAAEASVTGTFFRAADNGIRCIKAPCPSTTAYTLNSSDQHNVIRVGIDSVGAARDEVAAARTALTTREGILVAGGIAVPRCLPTATDCGPFLTAEDFYLRVKHQAGPAACGGIAGLGCKAGEYCSYAPSAQCGAADQMGTCARRPDVCTKEYRPVCGCNDQTYGNACMAAAAGVSVVSEGACVTGPTPGACGVRGGVLCKADEFCSFSLAAQCGAADHPGACAKRPEACIQVVQPVCGCDGRTYGNACTAASAGVSVASDGACAK